MTQRGLRATLEGNLESGCDAAGFEKQFRMEFWGVNVTQRCLRGSLEVNLGSGCDAAVLERQSRGEFGEQM